MRLVFTGDRVIALVVVVADGVESQDIGRFFNSFELVNGR